MSAVGFSLLVISSFREEPMYEMERLKHRTAGWVTMSFGVVLLFLGSIGIAVKKCRKTVSAGNYNSTRNTTSSVVSPQQVSQIENGVVSTGDLNTCSEDIRGEDLEQLPSYDEVVGQSGSD